MQDDLDAFYKSLTEFCAEELEAIKDLLAFDGCVTEAAPYYYWVGQCKVYKAVLEHAKASKRRIYGEMFEED